MFKALSRLFGSKPKAPRIPAPVAGADASPLKSAPVPAPSTGPAAASSAKDKWIEQSSLPLSRRDSPEALCGITPEMTLDEIRERLAKLYQRHNRAASSLDPKLREEAEFMLETLAGLRDRYFGTTPES